MESIDHEQIFRDLTFKEVEQQAKRIREYIEGALFYGIPIQDFPNKEDAYLVATFNIHNYKDLQRHLIEQLGGID